MLIDGAEVQTHFLKDLVTCADPSNPYTFLSYLSHKGRVYQFLNRKKEAISRYEFSDYLKWASENIPGLEFDSKVLDVKYNEDRAIG